MSLSFDQQVTFLYVKDLERSERFYSEVLGLELVLNQGLARIYRVGSGNAFLGICLSSRFSRRRRLIEHHLASS
jgi:catechol 2,3-dioxygenase-like lactoylglutathione lyase family enzyme